MVRRVRLGRRDAPERAQKWTGPPPWLMLATLIGFAVAPLVDHAEPTPAPQAVVVSSEVRSPRLVEPRVERPPASLARPGQAGHLAGGIRPVRLKEIPIGVATMNMYRKLTLAQAASDAQRLTSRPGVHVVGWQEASRFGSVLHGLSDDWATKTFEYPNGQNTELAVSWRRSEFSLVSAHQRRAAYGVSPLVGRYPFGNRQIAVVRLKHRETGRVLTVIDVHLPQAIEDLERPGHWRDTINAFRARNQLQRIVTAWKGAEGRWVVGTGDYNFDARADREFRPEGGPRRTLDGTAVSSYAVLGTQVEATHWPTDRRIDYVWVDRAAYSRGEIRFAGQWVLGGFNSDHRPLLTELVLS